MEETNPNEYPHTIMFGKVVSRDLGISELGNLFINSHHVGIIQCNEENIVGALALLPGVAVNEPVVTYQVRKVEVMYWNVSL